MIGGLHIVKTSLEIFKMEIFLLKYKWKIKSPTFSYLFGTSQSLPEEARPTVFYFVGLKERTILELQLSQNNFLSSYNLKL